MQVIFEQPIFFALLAHRYVLVSRIDLLFKGIAIYTLVYRLALLGWILYLYAEICFFRPVSSDWTEIIKYTFPFIFLFVFAVQCNIAWVYYGNLP